MYLMLNLIFINIADWLAFLGNFHPVLVHLPIGFLLIVFFIEVGRLLNKIEISHAILSFILFWAALTATLSCFTGYCLSLNGGYEAELLEEHKWQGIWVAVISWLLWFIKSDFLTSKLPFSHLLYAPLIIIGTFMLFVAGHHGGMLTHGETFLTQHLPEPFRAWAGLPPNSTNDNDIIRPIADINNALVYRDVVNPILKARCMQCHNANKSKGDLRMDDIELFKKGGENGPAFIAGKSADSDMMKRCLLPLEDDDHMPPKGKAQLSENQITLLSWWIDQGAPFDKKIVELKPADNIKTALNSLSSSETAIKESKESPVLALKVPAPEASAIETLKKMGLLVMPIAKGSNLVEVNAINIATLSDEAIEKLLLLQQQIVRLKLGDTKITDKAFVTIAKLKNLQKLSVENTAISDAAIASLKDLPYLEYLNVVNTQVSDLGLDKLGQIKSLRHLYVWKSKITEAGATKLKQSNPLVEISLGMNETQVAQFLKLDSAAAATNTDKK